MRRLGVVCLALFMAFGLTSVTGAEIKWEHDFQAAITKAKSEKRPILLDFYNPK